MEGRDQNVLSALGDALDALGHLSPEQCRETIDLFEQMFGLAVLHTRVTAGEEWIMAWEEQSKPKRLM